MIAYNRKDLDNRDIQAAAGKALAKKIITTEEYDRIREAYPYNLYTPNLYIRIGLFLLTLLVSACAIGLLGLAGFGSGNTFAGLFIVSGIAAYIALELFIRVRSVYMAGIDEALLWMASVLVLFGINACFYTVSPIAESLIVFLLGLAGVLRYTDRGMTLITYGALLSWVVYMSMRLGPVARALLPFLVMAVSVALYFLSTRMSRSRVLRHYHSCLALLRIATLLSFYLAGNYYIIREMNTFIQGQEGPISLSWLWWILTAFVPVIYIVRGIQKKDVLFLWTGLALVAASVFTVRYYYHILPAELAMIIGGAVLITGAYCLIRYLHTPKAGFTSAPPEEGHVLADLPVEGLILAESFKPGAGPTGPHTRFGGGSGGGGGAGGEY